MNNSAFSDLISHAVKVERVEDAERTREIEAAYERETAEDGQAESQSLPNGLVVLGTELNSVQVEQLRAEWATVSKIYGTIMHICPACNGTGQISIPAEWQSAANVQPRLCHLCKGSGVETAS